MADNENTPISGEGDTSLNAYCVSMHGDIDVFSFQTLREFFQNWKDGREEKNLLIDLSQVNYMGSSGWALLFSQNHVAKRRNGQVLVYNLNPRLERSLTMISGNRDLLKIAKNKEEALQMLKQAEPS